MQENEIMRQHDGEGDLTRKLSRALLHFQDRLLEANITPGSLCQVRRGLFAVQTTLHGLRVCPVVPRRPAWAAVQRLKALLCHTFSEPSLATRLWAR